MLVSNFVLMFSDRASSLIDIRYSLQITNLEEQTIDFVIECHVTAPEGEASPVNYLSNSLRASFNSAPRSPFSSYRRGNVVVVRYSVSVGARLSALFDLRTVDTFARLLKGFIALRVPPIRSDERGFYPIPQIGHPVRVLLHARREETRWNEIYARDPDDRYVMRFPTGLRTSSEAMAISTGRAENEITPEGILLFETDVIKYFRNP